MTTLRTDAVNAGRSRRSSIGRAIVASMLLVTGAGVAVATPAAAAPYTVRPCAIAPGVARELIPMLSRYTNDGVVAAMPEDRCHSGSGFGATVSGIGGEMPGVERKGMGVTVPPSAAHVTLISVAATIRVGPLRGEPFANPGTLETVDLTNGANPTVINGWAQGPLAAWGPTRVTQRPADPSKSVAWSVGCQADCNFALQPPLSGTGQGDGLWFEDIAIELDDPTTPKAPVFVREGILAGAPVSGVQNLVFSAADDDSGVDHVDVFSGGRQIGVAGNTGCTYWGAHACPTRRDGATYPVDISQLAPGPQTLSLRVVDAAGNIAWGESPPFTVLAPPPAPTPVPTPTPAPAPLQPAPNGDTRGGATVESGKSTGGSTTKDGDTLTTKAGKKVTINGRLLDKTGAPMARVALDVLQTLSVDGAQRTLLATITTDSSGRYSFTFTPTANAKVEVAYAEHVGQSDYSAVDELTVNVRAAISLRIDRKQTSRGKKVTFSGQVSVTPFPSSGVRVVIEYRGRSGWQVAAVRKTDAKGQFSWRRAFAVPGSYRFRARVLSDDELAALPGTSSTVPLRVR